MIKAVIFDLDGTIGNTLPLCITAFRKAIEPLAGKTLSDEEIIATFGPSEEGTIKKLIPDHYEEGLSRYLEYYHQMHDMCAEPFSGIYEILEYLRSKNIKIAIVTGKGEKSTKITLSKYKLDSLFEAVETGSCLGSRKAEGIGNILNKFNLDPEDVIYVGDAPTDIVFARKAKVGVVSAAWAGTADTVRLKELKPDEIFYDIEEFYAYLRRTIID